MINVNGCCPFYNTNTLVVRNIVEARGGAGLYPKAAVDAQFLDNIVYVRTANGVGLRVNYDNVGGAQSVRITARRNVIHASAGSGLSDDHLLP